MWPTFFIGGAGRSALWVELGCGDQEVTYTPSIDTPDARAGDLGVWVVAYDDPTSLSGWPLSEMPAGWTVFHLEPRNGNYHRSSPSMRVAVFCKVLEPGDLNTEFVASHSFSPSVSALYDLCSTLAIIPAGEFNPDVPLDRMKLGETTCRAALDTPYYSRFYGYLIDHDTPEEGQYVFNLLCITGNGASGITTEIDPAKVEIFNTDGVIGSKFIGLDSRRVYWQLKKATAGASNLFPGETFDEIMTGFTGVGLSSFSKGDTTVNRSADRVYRYANMVSNTGVSQRHYAEQTVTLVAGQTYTFNVDSRGETSSENSTGLSVVPPSGESNEFGFVGCSYNGWATVHEGSDQLSDVFNDPQGGREVWWWGHSGHGQQSGIPDFPTNPFVIVFTAQESGPHTFRVSLGPRYAGWAELTGNFNVTQQILAVSLIEGVAPAQHIPSTKPPYVGEVQLAPALYLYGYDHDWETNNAGAHMGFVVNPAGPIAPSRLVNLNQQFRWEILSDGLTTGDAGITGNTSYGSPMQATRLVYPTYNGTRRKYYAEVKIRVVGTLNSTRHFICAVPNCGGEPSNVAGNPATYGPYYWQASGLFLSPAGSPPTSSAWAEAVDDVFGVMVNYVDNEVVFYKNGVVTGTLPMLDTTDRPDPDAPMRFVMGTGIEFGVTAHEVTANFAGPFEYLPAGADPWDLGSSAV
jgi:hypothetical protein